MKYMLLICVDPAIEPTAGDPTIEQWLDEVGGRRLDGSQLRSIQDATTVRTRGDEVLLTDGPFAETKEQIVGYDVVDCADLDEAIRIASRHPCARFGSVEVRPFYTG
ncbi:YciI family protein [Actinosynnema sp. NPDC023658]|uniref:YciI family protein n=1 Tax=Actinosynnema sp. NPDC023658 TaxID=3155465 RepID=UPI0033F5742A